LVGHKISFLFFVSNYVKHVHGVWFVKAQFCSKCTCKVYER